MEETQRHNFFIIIALNLEDLAYEELFEKWNLFLGSKLEHSQVVKVKGGLELECTLSEGLSLNKVLKIPSRILLRIDELKDFKCRDFPKLYKKISKYSWNKWLKGQIPALDVTSHRSRVFDSRKIEKTFNEALHSYYKANTPKKISDQELERAKKVTVFIRFVDDFCTVSIDTSGEHLHKRSYRIHSGPAPIRENLASALVYCLSLNSDDTNLNLIDPMCGSGTFLMEALSFYLPQYRDDFAFKSIRSLEKIDLKIKTPPQKKSLFQDFRGFDISLDSIQENKLDEKILFTQNDLFTLEKSKHIEDGHCVIVNPPYGKRVRLKIGENVVDPKEYYNRLYDAILKKYSPKLLGLLCPKQVVFKSRPTKVLQLINGGIKVNFNLWQY